MTCNGCTALRGNMAERSDVVTLTTTGFTIQELLRIYVPPTADPVKIVGVVNIASLLTATTAIVNACIVPAASLSSLSALDADGKRVEFTDINPFGTRFRLEHWTDAPGEYVLGTVKVSGNAATFANGLCKTRLYAER